MLEKDRLADVLAILPSPAAFYKPAHASIYEAIQQLYTAGTSIDLLTVVEQLTKNGTLEEAGGAYYVTSITTSVITGAHVLLHARMVMERYLRRATISLCTQTIAAAYADTEDVFDTLATAEQQLLHLTADQVGADYQPIGTLALPTLAAIEQRKNQPQLITGVPTGYNHLDGLTNGWQRGNLIVIAARPSVGKTFFALNLALNACTDHLQPVPVGFFSLEMTRTELMERLLAAVSGVWLSKITSGELSSYDMQQLTQATATIRQMPLYIDDSSGLTLYQLKSKARRMVAQHHVGMLVVDYLQIMTLDSRLLREQQIAQATRELKNLAKDLQIPILLLSQLNREVDRERRDPQLSDLRESGAIEQDANLVLFLTRDDYQKTDTAHTHTHHTFAHIRKNRQGRLGKLPFVADKSTQRFTEPALDDDYSNNSAGAGNDD